MVWSGESQPQLSLQGAPNPYQAFFPMEQNSFLWFVKGSQHGDQQICPSILWLNKYFVSTYCVPSLTFQNSKNQGSSCWPFLTEMGKSLKELGKKKCLLTYSPSTPTFDQKHTLVELPFPMCLFTSFHSHLSSYLYCDERNCTSAASLAVIITGYWIFLGETGLLRSLLRRLQLLVGWVPGMFLWIGFSVCQDSSVGGKRVGREEED